MKRKWLKVFMLALMAGASFGSPMNPKEIEDLMYIMNQTRVEFTLPDQDDKGDGGKGGVLKHPWSRGENGAELSFQMWTPNHQGGKHLFFTGNPRV